MVNQTISHYRILEKLGEGGMGVVYKAQDTKLDRIVALKFLPKYLLCDESAKTRFAHEAKAASALNHTNITTIYEIDEVEGECFICMEYVEGKSVKELIKEKTLSIEETLKIAIQIAEGLHAAHKRGIVHRDIKSDNIMLTHDGLVKIMDFGLAKLRGVSRLTKTGTTLGTMQYMSPEQAQGIEVDQRSDIFSFGVVLYEVITGQLPFKGDHQAAIIYSILNETPEPLARYKANVPEGLQRILDKALKKERDFRYQSGAEMLADLKQLCRSTITGRLMVPHKRRSDKSSLLFAAIVVLVIVVGYALFSRFFSPFGEKHISVDRKSIAVLPFQNLSEDKADEYFSDGITEDIIMQISKIAQLKVISRTSVMQYKKSNKNLRDIAKELGVATILEGSVRRAGNRIRIVAQLIDAGTDAHLWGDTYDRQLTEVLTIQSNIAQEIAAAMKAKLSPAEKELIQKKGTANATAYDYYLKGREYYYQYNKLDNANAVVVFKKALDLDPYYALAYAGLADVFAQQTRYYLYPGTWLDSSIAASEKALSIDPNLAEAYKSLGTAFFYKGWARKALEAFQRAIQINPNYAPAVGALGNQLYFLGELDEGLKWLKKAVGLNPMNAYAYCLVGDVYRDLADDAEAEKWYRKALELQSDLLHAHGGLLQLHLIKGSYKEALAESRKMLSLAPDDPISVWYAGFVQLLLKNYDQARPYLEKSVNYGALAYIYFKKGQQNEAMKIMREGLAAGQRVLVGGSEDFVTPYTIAQLYAVQGNKSEACKWLQKAIDAGFRRYRWCMLDPMLESLHSDQQFKQMMAEVKGKVDEMRMQVEEMERE